MEFKTIHRVLAGIALAAMTLVLPATPAPAADVYLVARQFDKTMPDSAVIPMWGFAVDADSDLATIGTEIPSVPGPTIAMPAGDTTLNIHLLNELPDPVSIVIPGQPMTLSPVTITDGQGRTRSVAFTNETAPGTTNTYTWTGMKSGTFIYQSGSHPAVQVQMGLYGALTVVPSPGIVYSGIPYDSELLVFYSEIYSALHAAVDGGNYGVPPFTSTVDYKPDYFLVNGEPFAPGRAPMLAGGTNQPVLVRFLNAGLKEHSPLLLNGGYMRLIAEDGNPYPFSRERYAVVLPPGKTVDALWTPTVARTYPLFDRRHNLTTGGAGDGGFISHIDVSTTPCGDFTGDGSVNIIDALMVAQYVVGLRTCGQVTRFDLCDVSPPGVTDGSCNISDALRMAQCSVGLVPCNFPACPALTCGGP